jgi:hypothetical protein
MFLQGHILSIAEDGLTSCKNRSCTKLVGRTIGGY